MCVKTTPLITQERVTRQIREKHGLSTCVRKRLVSRLRPFCFLYTTFIFEERVLSCWKIFYRAKLCWETYLTQFYRYYIQVEGGAKKQQFSYSLLEFSEYLSLD